MLEGTRLVRYESLPHSFVYCIFEDRAGAVWVGTRGGLTRIIDGAVTTFTRRNGCEVARWKRVAFLFPVRL